MNIQSFVPPMKRIFAISLLLVFLSGQFNLTWTTHFCGQIAVDEYVTFGKTDRKCNTKEESCCSEDLESTVGAMIESVECCRDNFYSADSDTYFRNVKTAVENKAVHGAAFTISFSDLTPKSDKHDSQIASSPPLVPPDRQVQLQTFLL